MPPKISQCSWLVVQALKKCDVRQRKVLEANYGQWDDKKVKKVKQLYEDLGVEKMFKDYEEDSYKMIQAQLDKVTELPKEVFEVSNWCCKCVAYQRLKR